MSTPLSAKRTTHWRPDVGERLGKVLDSVEWEKTRAYASLSELAQSVKIDGHSFDIESAVILGEDWICPGTIYIELGYDVSSDDPVYMDDSYPIQIHFTDLEGEIKISDIDADISSFYE